MTPHNSIKTIINTLPLNTQITKKKKSKKNSALVILKMIGKGEIERTRL